MTEGGSFHYKTFKPLYKKAALKMCKECERFIEKGSKILDLGCGSGMVGLQFKDYFKSDVVGVDIIDNRTVYIPFEKFNGRKINFVDDSTFDVVLISYVLHHASYPLTLLKEAKRVTNRNIIIYEDIPEGLVSNLACKIHGNYFAKFIQKNTETGHFFNTFQWKSVFSDLELELIFEKDISKKIVKKKMFVLEKGV